MLSLGRNPGEYVVIGEDVIIQVVSIDGMLRLAIDAPKDKSIVRGEIYEQEHEVPSCIQKSRELEQGKSNKKSKMRQNY